MRFLLLDKITHWELGRGAVGVKSVAFSEDWFDDHFPLKPIMPGVLIIEGMAQLSGLLLEETVLRDTGRRLKALLSIIEKAKFRQPAYPGDVLEYHAEIASVNELGGKVKVRALRDRREIAAAELVFSFHPFENARLEARRQEILNLWLQGTRPPEDGRPAP